MFDSLGIGELGLILVVALLFIDPSKIGELARGFAKLRRKWNDIQREVREQFDTLTLEENLKESADAVRNAKARLRREARDAVRALPAAERAQASEAMRARLREWEAWSEASAVALFCGSGEEPDTDGMIRDALQAGKTVYLPRVLNANASARPDMHLVAIRDPESDLEEGAFGLLEPRADLPAAPDAETASALMLIPGTAFDERGGRVGRGKGYYDRFLEGRTGIKAGLAFEAQVLRKKLPLEPHDQLLDALLTERRLLRFSTPGQSPDANAAPDATAGGDTTRDGTR